MINDLLVTRQINQLGLSKTFFKWYEMGILGCGKNSLPWFNFEPFISWPKNPSGIIDEINSVLPLEQSMVNAPCLLPDDLNGYTFFTHYEYYAEKYIPEDVLNSFSNIYEMSTWVINNLSRPVWKNVLMAKKHPDRSQYWKRKNFDEGVWVDNLPLTQTWIESLTDIFKHVGRVVIYQSLNGNGVPIHRDYPTNVNGHNSHFIIVQLSGKRSAFVYDEITKEKIYTNSRAYMFNECDCHGIDAEDVSNFSIRIDGAFQDHICHEFNLINGKVFDLDYINGHKFNNMKIIEL